MENGVHETSNVDTGNVGSSSTPEDKKRHKVPRDPSDLGLLVDSLWRSRTLVGSKAHTQPARGHRSSQPRIYQHTELPSDFEMACKTVFTISKRTVIPFDVHVVQRPQTGCVHVLARLGPLLRRKGVCMDHLNNLAQSLLGSRSISIIKPTVFVAINIQSQCVADTAKVVCEAMWECTSAEEAAVSFEREVSNRRFNERLAYVPVRCEFLAMLSAKLATDPRIRFLDEDTAENQADPMLGSPVACVVCVERDS